MSRATKGGIGFAGVFAIVITASQIAVAEMPIKKLMGENFGGLQTILVSLISAQYGAIPDQAEIIREHANELTHMVPESAEAERAKFLAYANNLGAHAQDLKTISEALMGNDKARTEPGVDYLREALAAHYGGMVSMCVACHNQFRPLSPQ